jgi:hypothetical protein
MATRWMKWNEGTHIFEYSTDGVNFNPLPLDASILTQGIIDPARLPPGVPSGDGNNVFTGVLPLSLVGVAPNLIFTETDAPADEKNWQLITDGQTFKLRNVNDALSVFADILSIARANNAFTYSIRGAAADNHILANGNGRVALQIRQIGVGTSAWSQLALGNDASATQTVLQQFSTAWTTTPEPDFAGGTSLKASGAPGLSLQATAASGLIRFYTAGVKRFELTAAGEAKFSGNITTRGRATADGVWTTIAHAGANFSAQGTTWTVEAADQIHYRYTYLSANSMLISFDIRATSVAALTPYLLLKVPDGKTIAANTCGGGVASNNGTTAPLGIFALAAQTFIWLTPSFISGTQWAASANTTAVAGSIIVDLA